MSFILNCVFVFEYVIADAGAGLRGVVSHSTIGAEHQAQALYKSGKHSTTDGAVSPS